MKLKGDFMIYTRENNYKINITDLQKIYGIEINNEIKEILSEFNINKDNSLTFNEFLYIIYKIF
jgi:Ca2+-binding EF-hand superfamily protein